MRTREIQGERERERERKREINFNVIKKVREICRPDRVSKYYYHINLR